MELASHIALAIHVGCWLGALEMMDTWETAQVVLWMLRLIMKTCSLVCASVAIILLKGFMFNILRLSDAGCVVDGWFGHEYLVWAPLSGSSKSICLEFLGRFDVYVRQTCNSLRSIGYWGSWHALDGWDARHIEFTCLSVRFDLTYRSQHLISNLIFISQILKATFRGQEGASWIVSLFISALVSIIASLDVDSILIISGYGRGVHGCHHIGILSIELSVSRRDGFKFLLQLLSSFLRLLQRPLNPLLLNGSHRIMRISQCILGRSICITDAA